LQYFFQPNTNVCYLINIYYLAQTQAIKYTPAIW